MIPRTQLQMMAENFARRAEQHDKLGDTEGALKYQRLSQGCVRQLLDLVTDQFSKPIDPSEVKLAVGRVIDVLAL